METIGRYRVKRQLGRGGMGDVYLAHDPSLERDAAIKLLHKASLRGLRDEARVLAALRRPAIVTIYEIGEHDGQDFIAMEYLPGRTLRDVMNGGAPRAALLRNRKDHKQLCADTLRPAIFRPAFLVLRAKCRS